MRVSVARKISIVLLASAFIGCENDKGGSGSTSAGPAGNQIEKMGPAKISTPSDVQASLDSYGNGTSGYVSLVNRLLATSKHFISSVQGLNLSNDSAQLPFSTAPLRPQATATPCPKIGSNGSFKTVDGSLEGNLSLTVDFGVTGCTPKEVKEGILFGKIDVDLNAEKAAGDWTFRYEGFKVINKGAQIVVGADGSIKVAWIGKAIPMMAGSTGAPSDMTTTLDLKGVDSGREVSVKGESVFKQKTSTIFDTTEDMEVAVSGITHLLKGSSLQEIQSGKLVSITPLGTPEVQEGEEAKLKLDQRVDYGNSVFGRLVIESNRAVLSSSCSKNPVSGETTLSNELGAAKLTYRDACEGKALATINGQSAGDLNTVTLQPVATVPQR
ncbi:MAG: hypothetical protein HYT87_13310 [Nitrospirae bacterium]|nr:hypothetical protein [Nitrospirota bacterium]